MISVHGSCIPPPPPSICLFPYSQFSICFELPITRTLFDFFIRFSSRESFIGFYIWYYPISTILACLFVVGVRISLKTLCWKGSMAACLVYYIVWRVNLRKLSRKFVWALRKTTTNCRVTFINVNLVFPTNFRIIFSPHTNTVIWLEPYCGTITEPGLPAISLEGSSYRESTVCASHIVCSIINN